VIRAFPPFLPPLSSCQSPLSWQAQSSCFVRVPFLQFLWPLQPPQPQFSLLPPLWLPSCPPLAGFFSMGSLKSFSPDPSLGISVQSHPLPIDEPFLSPDNGDLWPFNSNGPKDRFLHSAMLRKALPAMALYHLSPPSLFFFFLADRRNLESFFQSPADVAISCQVECNAPP